MSLASALDIQHIKRIGIIVAIHSFIYGIGYLFGIGGFPDTILYMEVSTLVRPEIFGLVLIATSLALIYGYMQEKVRVVANASTVQSFVWLFATFVYLIDRDWLVAIAIAFVWSLLSGYSAYSFRERKVNQGIDLKTFLET